MRGRWIGRGYHLLVFPSLRQNRSEMYLVEPDVLQPGAEGSEPQPILFEQQPPTPVEEESRKRRNREVTSSQLPFVAKSKDFSAELKTTLETIGEGEETDEQQALDMLNGDRDYRRDPKDVSIWEVEAWLVDLRTLGLHRDDGSEYAKYTGYNLQWTATLLEDEQL